MKMNSLQFKTRIFLFLCNLLLSHQMYGNTSTTNVLFKWRAAEFDYPNERAKYEDIKRGQFIANNVAILDVDYHDSTQRYFVTSPQLRNGIPATLSEVIRGQEILRPFPGWPNKNYNRPSCQGPFSVFRTYIDRCGLMWIIDSGRRDIFNNSTLTCPPKLLIYDLNNRDHEILRYEFPTGVFTDRSLLINIITESYRSDCSDSIAYIADVNDHGLIVFDYARKTSTRIENKYFYPYPSESTITSNGVKFDIMDGIFGLALAPPTERNRKLYFHSFASVRESWVPVSVLKNQTTALDPVVSRTPFVLSPGKRAGQSTVEVMTDDGILIYPLIPSNAIACWNSRKPFAIENQHILKRDNENFQFISGMKLKDNRLLIMSSRLQNYIIGNVNTTDFKYRVVAIENVKRLLQNNPCGSGSSDDFSGSSSNGGFNGANYGESSGGYHHGGSQGGYGGSSSCRGSNCHQESYPAHTTSTTQSSGVVFKPKPRPHYNKEIGFSYAQNKFQDSNDTTADGTV